MSEYQQTIEAEVVVRIDDDAAPDAVTRITGDGGDEWRGMFYDLFTESDVVEHWAYNAVANGVEDAARLDGWADLPRGAVTMRVVEVLAI